MGMVPHGEFSILTYIYAQFLIKDGLITDGNIPPAGYIRAVMDCATLSGLHSSDDVAESVCFVYDKPTNLCHEKVV